MAKNAKIIKGFVIVTGKMIILHEIWNTFSLPCMNSK